MAGVSVRGDTRKLKALVKALASLSDDDGRRELTGQIAEEAIDQVKLGFEEQRDPYGAPWKRPQLADGDRKTLRDTGRLMNSLSRAHNLRADSFRIGTNAIYAAVHQYGATIVPVRAKALRFPIQTGTFVIRRRKTRRFESAGRGATANLPAGATGMSASHGKLFSFAFARKVRIPARPYMPESELPQSWLEGFGKTANAYLRSKFGR